MSSPQSAPRPSPAEQRRSAYLKAHLGLPEKMEYAIRHGSLIKGMSWEEVDASVGPLQRGPSGPSTTAAQPQKLEVWVSTPSEVQVFLFFDNGTLSRWGGSLDQ